MLEAELRQAAHGYTVLLVGPGELEPEFTLRDNGSRVAAGDEHAQRRPALRAQLVNARLQRAELLAGAARQNPQSVSWPAHCLRASQGFEFRGGRVELGDDLAVALPGSPQLLRLLGYKSFEPAPRAVVLGLDALVAPLEMIESVPECGVEPLGPLTFGRTHIYPSPVARSNSERA